MSTNDPSVLIEVLVATGALTALSETVRWFFGRNRSKVDSAQVVQGMAIDLLEPLHVELRRANKRIEDLTGQVEEALAALAAEKAQGADVASWALAAKALLDAQGVMYPTIPEVLRRAA